MCKVLWMEHETSACFGYADEWAGSWHVLHSLSIVKTLLMHIFESITILYTTKLRNSLVFSSPLPSGMSNKRALAKIVQREWPAVNHKLHV